MKRTRKILALLLCIVMCLSLFPVSAFAAEEEPAEVVTDEATVPEVTDDAQGEEAGEPADLADPAAPVDGEGTGEENGTDTDPVDPADPAAGTELNGGENTDPADPADGTDPADEPTDGDDAEEAEETEEEEEEEEQAELPYGFVGMPEDYEFSKAELAAKRALTEMGTVDLLAGLVPDVNYREGQILVSADSREYAELAAAAFDAEILRFNGFTAKLQLNSATTLQAVEAAANMELPLPAAEPNYINDMGILPGGNPPATDVTDQALQATTWMDWMEAAEITDPFVTNPDYWNGYQWMHDMVKTYGAWSVTTGSSAVTVAVIDTGVDYEHEDLPNVTTGGDYVSEDDDPWDENNHGTHVSGIIAAAWNGIGGIGIAPGVEIYAVRVVDASGSYETDDLIDGIDDAISHGVDIINLSLGSTYDEIVLRRAIERAVDANITVVVAMGNEASNVKKFPAAYEDVVAVAAVDITGNRANYSNYGAWCDVSAPGSGIMSTIPGDSYDWMDGTSMATPVVSGLAALYMSAYGNPGPAAMQSILRAAVNKGGGAGMGTGIVDATKLFANENDRKAPIVTAMKKAPYSDDESAVSPVKGVYELSTQDRLLITSGNTAREKEECMFVFADNGKKPAIVNGAPANGTKASGGSIELSEYPIGKTITFNIAEANEVGFCSNVTTVKVKIVPSVNREILDNIEVSIQAPTKVVAGKSVTLSALVSSTYDDGGDTTEYEDFVRTVTWSIPDAAHGQMASINAGSGKLTVKKNVSGTITVKAVSNANPGKSATVNIEIVALPPIAVMSLQQSIPLYVGDSWAPELVVADALGEDLSDVTDIIWSSSKAAVATVDEDGVIQAVGKGKAVITAAAADGSGKKATVSIVVKQQLTSVIVAGQTVIAPGKTAKFTAAVLPKNADSKAVAWFIKGIDGSSDAPAGITVDPKGVVTVAASVSIGTEFSVVAGAADGQGAEDVFPVTVMEQAQSVQWCFEEDVPDWKLVWDKKGNLAGAFIYSIDLPQTDDDAEDILSVFAWRTGVFNTGDEEPWSGIEWTSSNPKVASIEGSSVERQEVDGETVYVDEAIISAGSPGTATITAKASDGSGRKASFTVKVVIPASSLVLTSGGPGGTQMVGYGKSIASKASFGSTYGKPTITALNWSFEACVEAPVEDGDDDEWYWKPHARYTSEIKAKKLVSINSKGVLSVKSGLQKYIDSIGEDLVIRVYADTTDGSGYWAYIDYSPVPTMSKLVLSVDDYYVIPAKKQSLYKGNTYYLYPMGKYGKWYYDYFNGGLDFIVTSSNPNVAGATYANGVVYLVTENTGSAKITIKACDGSNKSASFSFKVVN